jgi:hypothetical protein
VNGDGYVPPVPLPWERPDVPSAFTLVETARRLGAYRWVELRLYEAMGAWVGSIPELEVRLAVGGACRAHAWHAEVWLERFPLMHDLDPATSTAPADPSVARLLDAVAGATDTLERLVGTYRVVVPRLVAAYTAHANHTSAAADGPVTRSLGLVLADEAAGWRDGELLVQSLIATPDHARRAAEHQGRLEAIVAASGGLAGPATLRPRV